MRHDGSNPSVKSCGLAVPACWVPALAAFGQSLTTTKETPPIQDNSFLVEEAYNQERGVVQHISTFSRMWNSKDWSYTLYPGVAGAAKLAASV